MGYPARQISYRFDAFSLDKGFLRSFETTDVFKDTYRPYKRSVLRVDGIKNRFYRRQFGACDG